MKNPSEIGNIGQELGFKYLTKKGYKIKKGVWDGVWDIYTNEGIIDIKAKLLPSEEPYRIEFTPAQVTELRNKYFHSKKYAKILMVIIKGTKITYKLLDMKFDFARILSKQFTIIHRAGHGDKRVKFRIMQYARTW
jgi:hypothetical protein